MFNRLAFILLIGINLSQTDSPGRVHGTVMDPNEAVIVGARLLLENLDNNITLRKTTDDAGAFSFEGVSRGNYRLLVEAFGFEASVKQIFVTPEQYQPINIKLSLRKCPDPVIRLSKEEKSKRQICPVHNKALRLGIVPVVYGLVVVPDVASNFPNAHSVYYGGCIIGCYDKAEVLYCSMCRKAESKWNDEHKHGS